MQEQERKGPNEREDVKETSQAEGSRDPGETEHKVGRTEGQAEGERDAGPASNVDEHERTKREADATER